MPARSESFSPLDTISARARLMAKGSSEYWNSGRKKWPLRSTPRTAFEFFTRLATKTSPTLSRRTFMPSFSSSRSRIIEQSKPDMTRSPGLYLARVMMIATFSGGRTVPLSSMTIPLSASGSNPTPKSASFFFSIWQAGRKDSSLGAGPRPGNRPSVVPFKIKGLKPSCW